MSTNKTQNYQLHTWTPEDEHLRTELNANFTKLDTALKAEETARIAATPRISVGAYVGSVRYSDNDTIQTITLGFRPKAVLAMSREGNGSSTGLALDSHPATYGLDWFVRVTSTGFEVRNASSRTLNSSENTYHYWAIG